MGDVKSISLLKTKHLVLQTVSKGEQGDPIIEDTSFGWVIHGGDEYTDDQYMFRDKRL
jgi:hypothetical protein